MNKTNFEPPITITEMPYPPIQISERNINYEKMMLDNLAGSNSEMSALSLYFYNSLITGNQYKEISDVFHEVMMAEMKHLEIFGEIVFQLGADPRLWSWRNNRSLYWNPGYNKYSMKLKDILSNAIKSEKWAVEKYIKQAASIKDMCIVENLNRIIQDENKHIEMFTLLYNKYICD